MRGLRGVFVISMREAWIEIELYNSQLTIQKVVSLVGVWIEMLNFSFCLFLHHVAPLVGRGLKCGSVD